MAEDKNTPFSVRMDTSDKEKLLKLIQESGTGSNKDFMNVLMSAYELNKVKVEVPEASESIKKVEELTQLINDYFVNMSKHIKTNKESMNLQFTKDIDVYKVRVDTLKEENSELEGKVESLQAAYNNSCNDIEESRKELESKDKLVEQLKENLEDKTTLVDQYKEKNDTLAGLVSEYKNYKVEVESYKNLLADAQTRKFELENTIKEKDFDITKLNDAVEELKIKHESELSSLKEKSVLEIDNLNSKIEDVKSSHLDTLTSAKEKAEFEKEKALLAEDKKHQEAINKLNDEHNEKIRQLLHENEDYNKKVKELLDQLEESKKQKTEPVKTPKNSISTTKENK